MKKYLLLFTHCAVIIIFSTAIKLNAQTMEWRLTKPTYIAVDPDGAGPATGTATFTLQIHSITNPVSNVNVIATAYSYQLTKAIVPTGAAGPGCGVATNPANIVISKAFVDSGFSYNSVNQCGVFSQTAGGQTFETRAVGSLIGPSITISTDWMDVFTVTLWSISNTQPEAGYVIINSGSGGSPGEFTTYSVSDKDVNEYPVNSLTHDKPLALGSGALPITLSSFKVNCTDGGAKIKWQTASEENNSYFEIEKSNNGATGWKSIGTYKANGNSTSAKEYDFVDVASGAAFYRLKQVDRDGKFSYSSIQRTTCESQKNKLVVFPIPAKNVLNMVLSTDKGTKATVVLVDLSGRIVTQFNTELQKGVNNLKLNVAGVSTGEYFLRIVGAEIFRTQKVSINR